MRAYKQTLKKDYVLFVHKDCICGQKIRACFGYEKKTSTTKALCMKLDSAIN